MSCENLEFLFSLDRMQVKRILERARVPEAITDGESNDAGV